MKSDPKVLRFGMFARTPSSIDAGDQRKFIGLLSSAMGRPVEVVHARTYDELAEHLQEGHVELSWLPPIVFCTLLRRGVVSPLVSHPRGGNTRFYAALIVRTDSDLVSPLDLLGRSVAWVDRWSASGYVVPRIHLPSVGIDPRKDFRTEQFLEGHEAVARAVIGGRVDAGATHVTLDPFGRIVKGGWTKLVGGTESTRVLTKFGPIPSDVTAARADLSLELQRALCLALLSLSSDPRGSALVRRFFGIDDFASWSAESYGPLMQTVAEAQDRGLLDATTEGELGTPAPPPTVATRKRRQAKP